MIRLYVDHKYDESGKGKFLQRLKPELEKLGVEFTNYKKANVVLGVNKYRKGISDDKRRKINDDKKRIMRLDGVHLLKTKRNLWANKVVKQDCDRSDAIIYQSDFCKKMWKGVMGVKCKKEYTIFNGANTKNYKIARKLQDGKKYVMTSAKWFAGKTRDNKRLVDMVDIMRDYFKYNPDVVFLVAGETGGWNVENPRIKFLGHLTESNLREYLKAADCYLYLSYYEWCANSVVEAIVSGLPVICTAGDGNQELVGQKSGIVLDIDKTVPTKMVDKEIIPPLEKEKVFEALDIVLRDGFDFEINPELKIENTAKRYKEVLENVVT